MDIINNSKTLPRATAKEKDGIVLYWVEELQVAGIHYSGVAKILECDPSLPRKTAKKLAEDLGDFSILNPN